jgi:hypothetical protein
VLEDNTKVEKKMELLSGGDLSKLTLTDFKKKLTKPELAAYVKVRSVVHVTENLKLPKNKGNEGDVNSGTDCLLLRAWNLRGKPATATVPEIPQVSLPKALEPPECVKIFQDNIKMEDFTPTAEWCDLVAKYVHPLAENGRLNYWKGNLEELNRKATTLAEKEIARLPIFLRNRCPRDLTGWNFD